MGYSNALFQKRFPQLVGYNDLDDDYALDTERSQAYIFHMSNWPFNDEIWRSVWMLYATGILLMLALVIFCARIIL
jgi:hypothetical protein